MAEIMIPLALLSGMYILSNQNEDEKQAHNKNVEKNRETFINNNTTLNKVKNAELPNNKQIENNFPVSGTAVLKHSPQYYHNPNNSKGDFFQEVEYKKQASQNPNTYKSLTGNDVTASDLNHNNMVPFFGTNVKQYNGSAINESRLDNMIGSGSQHIKKQEMAPLFRPEENMHWAHGAPNQSDFYQSRVNPSASMANVKPFQEIRVGPGLNKEGGVLGSGGFNSGMEAREQWISKTVDQLRTKNNPKLTYEGVTLGGKAQVTNRGSMGRFEQHKPDTYFINGPERYLTTTGLEKAQTARSEQIMPEEARTDTTREYFGTGADTQNKATYTPGTYMDTKRNVLDPFNKHITNAHAPNRQKAGEGDHGINGFKESVTHNNRSLTTQRQPEYGIVSSIAKAVIAPIMDLLRPTRKENVVGNLRMAGNANGSTNIAGYVYNPADRTKTTIREMTEERKEHNFINSQNEVGGYGYIVNKQRPVNQARDTTNTEYMGGNNNQGELGGYGYIVNEQQPVNQARDTTNTEYMGGNNNQGELGGYGYTVSEQQPVSQARDTTNIFYIGGQNKQSSDNGGYGYIVNKQTPVTQARDTTSTYYVGNSGNTNNSTNIRTYDSAYNANLIDKEPMARGRVPMGNNVKVFNGQDNINIKIDKLESDRHNNRMFVPQQVSISTPSVQHKGQLTARSEYGQGVNCERNAPELLSAFHKNPYTHSLTGAV